MPRLGVETHACRRRRPAGCTVLTAEVEHAPGNGFGLWRPKAVFREEDMRDRSVDIARRHVRSRRNSNNGIPRWLHAEPFPIAESAVGETCLREGLILSCDGGQEVLREQFANIESKG